MVARVRLSRATSTPSLARWLVQAVRVAPPDHQAPGELVHDDDLAVLDDVVDVPVHERVGLERDLDVVVDVRVLQVREVFHVKNRSAW